MDSAWPLLLFLFALMGTGVLILVSGIQSREEELRKDAENASMPNEVPEGAFFGTADAPLASSRESDELALLRKVEREVRRQTELVTRFVQSPSINSLHEDDAEAEPELSLFCRIQKHLELERQLVGEFVSDPSFDRLHGKRATAV